MSDYLQQQPDIDALAQGLQVAGTEAQKISNLPQFQQGNNILQSLANLNQHVQAMQQQMQQTQQQMQQMQQQMENRFDRIERRLDASEHNNIARFHNSSHLQFSEPLVPIHDRYNQPVNGFPATIHQIDNMTGHQLSEVFERLDQNTSGNVSQRRTWLKQAIGIYQQRTG